MEVFTLKEWEEDFDALFKRVEEGETIGIVREDGKKAVGTIKSSIEGEKLGASIVFIDLGITDAITDKHRTYPSSFVIPVR